ncbi:glycosyltransferase family 2 protein [Amnibacterium kyonggiense]|uniref:Glycosyltransferase involved in cell wall biosynthesis n=1 Tax=Amnibacterium kyonggiense TaxID=595671 RepID=A0A4R7FD51_9MICO|nr:glycosyltransferase family 2 protein [Amnibacterium kyonggiense]TDS74869.1 glycosyltransferase involved in cell wall biosynthesis [Amnibacterium kyonggiense]
MKVSVVVPVFNTGPGIAALIDSLRAQTLPASQWEAVFVDDGSTDDTADRVERLIADVPNMRLLREAPSGWPGRPRNVGMDAAHGEYVFFSDDDDTLGSEALERLAAFADAHGSDVVVPKTVGRNRGVPSIPRTVVDAQADPALLMGTLAPQKLFRLAFLRDRGIRFQEGHFRLEDHLFVVTAYLRARRVSVYADYPCYYLAYETGRAHISQQQPEWHGYFGSIRACLDRVDEEAVDTEQRRIMRSRWLRVEVIARLRGDGWAKLGSPELLHEAHRLLVERYDDADFHRLRTLDRLTAELVLAGRDDDIAAVARWETGLQVSTVATDVRVEADGGVRIELRSELVTTAPLPDLADPAGRLPSAEAVLQQVAAFTRIGVELQHTGTLVRRTLRVEQRGDGVAVATPKPGDPPVEDGTWAVIALAGEHRSRRRRPVAAARGLRVADARRTVGTRTVQFIKRPQVALQARPVGTPNPMGLVPRVARRLRRTVARVLRSRRRASAG